MVNPVDEILDTGFLNNHKVRIHGTRHSPIFVAKDILAALGYESRSSRILNNLEWGEKVKLKAETTSGKQEVIAITEAGFYMLIFSSKKKAAKAIRKKLCKILSDNSSHEKWIDKMV